MANLTTKIFFDPWIGQNYGKPGSIFNKRILALGGSHYCKDCEDCGSRELHPECTSMTQDVVKEYLSGNCHEYWKKTFSTFINSFYDRSTSDEERKEFFKSVIFYNYLQTCAGEDPYSASQYDYTEEKHLKAFYEVIDKTLPDVVISWGSKVWEALPDDWNEYGEAEKGTPININGDNFQDYQYYPYKNRHKIMLILAHHPSVAYDRLYHYKIFSELIFK
jgi:hypothetical protein